MAKHITTGDLLLSFDPVRLFALGGQNDDALMSVLASALNEIANLRPDYGVSVLTHTTKQDAREGIGAGYAAAALATAGSAVLSNHARSNWHQSRLLPKDAQKIVRSLSEEEARTEARARRESANTAEARAARFDAEVASCQAGLDEARAVGKQVQEVLALVGQLGSKLSAIASAKSGIEARLASAITNAGAGTSPHAIAAKYRALHVALDGLVCPDHLLRALYAAGVGRVGIPLTQGHFTLAPPKSEWGVDAPETVVAGAVQQLKTLANGSLSVLKHTAEAKEAA